MGFNLFLSPGRKRTLLSTCSVLSLVMGMIQFVGRSKIHNCMANKFHDTNRVWLVTAGTCNIKESLMLYPLPFFS